MSDELPVRLYRPDELGQMFGGLSRSTIMALRLSEKWPHTKVGATILFSLEDIQAIMARGQKTPEPPRKTRTRRTQ